MGNCNDSSTSGCKANTHEISNNGNDVTEIAPSQRAGIKVGSHLTSPSQTIKPEHVSPDEELDDDLLQLVMHKRSKGKGIDINTLMSQHSSFSSYIQKPKLLKPLQEKTKNVKGKKSQTTDASDSEDGSAKDKDHQDALDKEGAQRTSYSAKAHRFTAHSNFLDDEDDDNDIPPVAIRGTPGGQQILSYRQMTQRNASLCGHTPPSLNRQPLYSLQPVQEQVDNSDNEEEEAPMPSVLPAPSRNSHVGNISHTSMMQNRRM